MLMMRLLVLATLGVLLSGCYMLPMALLGPATSNFSTASIIKSGFSTSAGYVVKRTTGKTIGAHAFDAMFSDDIEDILQQAYFPKESKKKLVHLDLSPIRVHKD